MEPSFCRSFLWSGGLDISRKSPLAGKKVCRPKNQGGLNIIVIEKWNKATLLNFLWNLSGKPNSLWVKWIHTFYLKKESLMEVKVKANNSWIMKAIMK